MTGQHKYYLKVLLVCYFGWFVLFELVGNFAARMPTVDLTTSLDRQIPLIPEFVWAYEFCYIAPVFLLLLVEDGHRLNRVIVAFVAASLSAFLVYLLLPIAFPRPELGGSLAERILALEYQLDFKPGANKLPSLHVATVWLIFLGCRGQRLGRLGDSLLLVGAIVVSLSTLFVKQHIVLDVVAGVGWAFGWWWIVGRLYERWIPDPSSASGSSALRSLYKLLKPAGLTFTVTVLAIAIIKTGGWPW